MSHSTLVDPDTDDGQDQWQSASLPISSSSPERSTPETGMNSVKWVFIAEANQLVPFVDNSVSNLVHSGRDVMQCEQLPDGRTTVRCLSGCADQDSQCDDRCFCLCHVLETWYRNNAPEQHAHN